MGDVLILLSMIFCCLDLSWRVFPKQSARNDNDMVKSASNLTCRGPRSRGPCHSIGRRGQENETVPNKVTIPKSLGSEPSLQHEAFRYLDNVIAVMIIEM
jgi:hypothetical protein